MEYNPKNRLLYLLKILQEQTDEDHQLTVKQLISTLDELHINANRKSIYDDIKILQDFGFDIVCNRSVQNSYFYASRNFELPELKLLVDAVASARFITRRKSDELIRKLTNLASVHQADDLNRQVFVVNRIKSENESIFYIIDLIYTAIKANKKIKFQYYEYNESKKRVMKHSGKVYFLSPYSFMYDDDRYYLLGYSDSHEKIITLRVDRICNADIYNADSVPLPKDFNVYKYSKEIFNMYDGAITEITLLCQNNLMNVIIDRFGTNVDTVVYDENHFKTTIEVAVSPTLFGWLFQFVSTDRMRILSPENFIKNFRDLASKI